MIQTRGNKDKLFVEMLRILLISTTESDERLSWTDCIEQYHRLIFMKILLCKTSKRGPGFVSVFSSYKM